MNRHSIKKYVVALFILFASTIVIAEERTTRSYQLHDHGFIQFLVPISWREEVHQSSERLPPKIVFTPKSGSSFQILLTIFSAQQGMAELTPSGVKKHVERAADGFKSQSIEKTIAINELKGPSAIGFYFSVTDKSPKPGEYKYMTQGIARIGELTPTFTILSNEGAENAVADSLTMLENAVYTQKSR